MNARLPPPGIESSRIALVQASWHRDLVDRCTNSFIDSMQQHGIEREKIDVYTVPGAYEIPLQASLLARTGEYAAIVAVGLIVDGGIYRHEFVARAVINGLMQVQLETLVPVMSAVLTPHHFHESEVHHRFFAEHLTMKGQEVAKACSETVRTLAAFASSAR